MFVWVYNTLPLPYFYPSMLFSSRVHIVLLSTSISATKTNIQKRFKENRIIIIVLFLLWHFDFPLLDSNWYERSFILCALFIFLCLSAYSIGFFLALLCIHWWAHFMNSFIDQILLVQCWLFSISFFVHSYIIISNSSRFVHVIYFDKISSCVLCAFRRAYIYTGHICLFSQLVH